MEIWRDIEGYEWLYQVSNLGNVKSLQFGPKSNHRTQNQPRMLKIAKSSTGYTHVQLYKEGKSSTISVHKLVAKAFVPNPLANPEVNHIDANRANNKAENLEWVTHKENLQHAVKLGNRKPPRKNDAESRIADDGTRRNGSNKRSKNPVLQYTPNGKFVKKWDNIAEIEKFYNCNRTGIANCLSGKNKTSFNFIWIAYNGDGDIAGTIPPAIYGKKNCGKETTYHQSGKKGRKVLQYTLDGELIKEWDNCYQASKELKIAKQNIYVSANSKHGKSHGYIWKLAEEG